MDKKEPKNAAYSTGWDQHEKDQILFRVRNSTPRQRVEMLEEMIAFAITAAGSNKNK